jgi:hypothetical protein
MPVVHALVVELAGRALPRQLQQPGFVEGLTDRAGCPRHDRDVSKSDLALCHGLVAFSHLAQALADRQPVGRRRRGHAAVESHPVDDAVGAFLVPVLGLVKGGREL